MRNQNLKFLLIFSFIICFHTLNGQEIIEKGRIILSDPFVVLSREWQIPHRSNSRLLGRFPGRYHTNHEHLTSPVLVNSRYEYGIICPVPARGRIDTDIAAIGSLVYSFTSIKGTITPSEDSVIIFPGFSISVYKPNGVFGTLRIWT